MGICLPMQGTGVRSLGGKILHATEQLSPCATTTEPAAAGCTPRACAPWRERPPQRDPTAREQPLLAPTRESPHSSEDPAQPKTSK